MDRIELKPLLGKPVLVIGDRTESKKAAQNLLLVKNAAFIYPRLHLNKDRNATVSEKIVKIEHCWVPGECAEKNGWWGFVDIYTRNDGTSSYGLRQALTEGERKHLLIRLLVNNMTDLFFFMQKRSMEDKQVVSRLRMIIAFGAKIFETNNKSKWGDLAVLSLPEDTRQAFAYMLRDLILIEKRCENLLIKKEKIKQRKEQKRLISKGFCNS